MTDVVQHLIEGEHVDSAARETFESTNPATGEVIARVALGRREDVDRAVESSWKTFQSGVWSRLAPRRRAGTLRRLAELIRRDAEEIARVEAMDSGKPVTSAGADVRMAASLTEYVATLPEHVRGHTFEADQGYLSYSRREPYGVVGAIAPWNFPFVYACWKTLLALAVGNSVVLKMAEQTPLSTDRFGTLCLEAGIPPGVVNVVHGDGETGAALAEHPRVPMVTFTGSTETGRAVLRAGAEHVKAVHLELGGKSPNLVFADADLEQALAGSLFTSFFNSGQVCTSGSRILLAADLAPTFLEELTQRASGLVVGDPLDESTHLGPLVSREQLDRVTSFVEEGRAAGARVVLGGEPPSVPGLEAGFFIAPTVFQDVTPDMRIGQEEIFGPVLSVMVFDDEDEAIELANSVAYGLAATVWTNDLARALRCAERLDAGIVWTNCSHYLPWNTPYEGHKVSGLGEDLGLEAIETFTKLKVHHINFAGRRMRWGA